MPLPTTSLKHSVWREPPRQLIVYLIPSFIGLKIFRKIVVVYFEHKRKLVNSFVCDMGG
jgi:hypothetical protein